MVHICLYLFLYFKAKKAYKCIDQAIQDSKVTSLWPQKEKDRLILFLFDAFRSTPDSTNDKHNRKTANYVKVGKDLEHGHGGCRTLDLFFKGEHSWLFTDALTNGVSMASHCSCKKSVDGIAEMITRIENTKGNYYTIYDPKDYHKKSLVGTNMNFETWNNPDDRTIE